jgi:hypothetical protein
MATIRELKKQASELHIKGYGNLNKAELMEAIRKELFIQEQCDKQLEEQIAAIETPQEPTMNTTKGYEFNTKHLLVLAAQGWVWAAVYAYNNRHNIPVVIGEVCETFLDGAEHIAKQAVELTLTAVVIIYFSAAAWSLLMDDVADYIEKHSYFDMLKDLGNLIKRGFGLTSHWVQQTVGVDYGYGYFYLYCGSHTFRFTLKPRLGVVHINLLS